MALLDGVVSFHYLWAGDFQVRSDRTSTRLPAVGPCLEIIARISADCVLRFVVVFLRS